MAKVVEKTGKNARRVKLANRRWGNARSAEVEKEPVEVTLASLNGYTAAEWITRTEISRMCNPSFDMAMYVEELDESLG